MIQLLKRLACIFLSALAAQAEPFDVQGFIDSRLAAGAKRVVLPPGRYEVLPVKGEHLRFKGLSGIEIVAEGVELVCTETTRAITVANCTNLVIRGLVIDYDPLPFTQGRIVALSDDAMVHEIELSDGFPRADAAIGFKYEIFDGETRNLRFGSYYDFTVEAVEPNRLKITKQAWERRKKGGEKVGDGIVIGAQHLTGRALPHAVLTDASVGTVFENVTLYASPTFGFFETHCAGSIYRNCTIYRREGRLRSLNADAFHSKFAMQGPQIIGCTAMWQGDDCINICGAYHLVLEADGDTLRVWAKQSMDIQPGDAVELVDASGNRLPDARAISVKPAGAASGEELAALAKLDILDQVKRLLKKTYVVRLDRAVELPHGSVVSSLNRTGNGFAVKDCTFGNNRSRGILIKASNGEVSGNRIENCHMEAIKIAPEYQWLESGYSRNLTIKGNTVVNSGAEALQIHAIGSGAGFEDIRIGNNRFQTPSVPAVLLPATGCVVLPGNTLNGKPMDERME